MNSDTTVNNLHTIIVLVTSVAATFGLSLPADQVSSAEKGIVALVGIVTTIISWVISHRHHAATAAPAAAPAPPAPSRVTKLDSVAQNASLFLVGLILAGWAIGCSTIDPALPGQTSPAPALAFTNGSAYIFGHPASSNEVYLVSLEGTEFGVTALLKDDPGATNYLNWAKVVFQNVSGETFSQASLSNALAAIPLQNAGDDAILDSIIGQGLSLGAAYVQPLLSKDTNAYPFINAALRGIADGL